MSGPKEKNASKIGHEKVRIRKTGNWEREKKYEGGRMRGSEREVCEETIAKRRRKKKESSSEENRTR